MELTLDTARDTGRASTDRRDGEPPRPSSRRRPPLDRDGWVVLLAGLYAAAFVAWVLISGGPDRTSTVVSDVAFLPIGLVAALMAWRASRHPALDPATRRAWRLMGLAFFSWFCGDAMWFWFEAIRGVQPFPSAADAGYLCFYPLLLWGLLGLPGAPRDGLDRLKVWLDAGIVLLGGTMVLWYLVIQPTIAPHENDALKRILAVAYPVGDLVVVFGIAVLLLRRPAPGSRAALRFLVAGASLFVVADVAYARMTLTDSYHGPGIPDVFWMVAIWCFLTSAAVQRRLAARPAELDDEASTTSHVSKLPYVALAIGYGFMAWVAGREAVSPLNGLVLGAIGLTVLVAARQMTAQQENLRLTNELAELASVDGLTGLRNRRTFFELAEREWARTMRTTDPLSAIMIDVDHFKRINDSLGHAAGDAVLAAVARCCQEQLRSIDVIGRYGGDELVCLLPNSTPVDALGVAERLRAAVNACAVSSDAGEVSVGISLGVATAAAGCANLATLLAQADAALLQAKQRGRDQVQAWYPGLALTP